MLNPQYTHTHRQPGEFCYLGTSGGKGKKERKEADEDEIINMEQLMENLYVIHDFKKLEMKVSQSGEQGGLK